LKKLREEFEAQREKIEEELKTQDDFTEMWEDSMTQREKQQQRLFKSIPSFADIYYNFFRKYPLDETVDDPCMRLI
jgi:hypothetical protein